MSSRRQPPHDPPPPARERTLERRLLGWLLALTVAPALIVLAVGGWALGTSLDVAGSLGPWEEVAVSGVAVVELAEPVADSTLQAALEVHREALSRSLTQARRWGFLGERFTGSLPWLVLLVSVFLVVLAYGATRQLARQLAQPIEGLVQVAERMGRGDPLPPPARRSVHEVAVLDRALRDAAEEIARSRDRAVAAERLRVWGEMARRVAHEMKNPLTPLRFAAHRLKRAGGGAPGSEAEAVEVIDQEVRRLEELAAQFSALGRPPEGPATGIDLRELVDSLVRSDAVGAIVGMDAPNSLPLAYGHYDSLFRAFRNIIRNAMEAMEPLDEPRLDVTIRVLPGSAVQGVDRAGHAVRGETPERWIEVRIADAGPGLPPGGADRIFEPDFTTRTRGTGLGLALVRQAVSNDGGTVAARNREDGSGAELIIRLPAAAEPTPQEPMT